MNLVNLSLNNTYFCHGCQKEIPNDRNKIFKHIDECKNACLEGDLEEDGYEETKKV